MQILDRKEIENALSIERVFRLIEEGFIAYSQKKTVIPPVAAMQFENPPGDCHIKYGYLKEGSYFVVKIATGFPLNTKSGLPAGNGMIVLFSKKTGAPLVLFNDEGFLTDMRTAIAGAIAAKTLVPSHVECIGCVGTGAQAYYQLSLLPHVTRCRKVLIWGRDGEKARRLAKDPRLGHFSIQVAPTLDSLAASCNLIVTTTSSKAPLLFAHHIKPGTHITAVGADDIGKQELDPSLFRKADLVVCDSIAQCLSFGDTSHAVRSAAIKKEDLMELGALLANPLLGRKNDTQITICDLTGIAAQDLQIAIAAM
ncbi:MAG: deaminase [Chlamydiae bacterium RIFCSPHIGHO2_12_FULL_49_11]|nr:MAG: deaminase [Chlamydiae bacterium RIFCSPHIGHO2_12_FULL_49_11]